MLSNALLSLSVIQVFPAIIKIKHFTRQRSTNTTPLLLLITECLRGAAGDWSRNLETVLSWVASLLWAGCRKQLQTTSKKIYKIYKILVEIFRCSGLSCYQQRLGYRQCHSAVRGRGDSAGKVNCCLRGVWPPVTEWGCKMKSEKATKFSPKLTTIANEAESLVLRTRYEARLSMLLCKSMNQWHWQWLQFRKLDASQLKFKFANCYTSSRPIPNKTNRW